MVEYLIFLAGTVSGLLLFLVGMFRLLAGEGLGWSFLIYVGFVLAVYTVARKAAKDVYKD